MANLINIFFFLIFPPILPREWELWCLCNYVIHFYNIKWKPFKFSSASSISFLIWDLNWYKLNKNESHSRTSFWHDNCLKTFNLNIYTYFLKKFNTDQNFYLRFVRIACLIYTLKIYFIFYMICFIIQINHLRKQQKDEGNTRVFFFQIIEDSISCRHDERLMLKLVTMTAFLKKSFWLFDSYTWITSLG